MKCVKRYYKLKILKRGDTRWTSSEDRMKKLTKNGDKWKLNGSCKKVEQCCNKLISRCDLKEYKVIYGYQNCKEEGSNAVTLMMFYSVQAVSIFINKVLGNSKLGYFTGID